MISAGKQIVNPQWVTMSKLLHDDTQLKALINTVVKDVLGAERAEPAHRLQALWGGQGSLLRWRTNLPGRETIIVKYMAPDSDASHPRGWNTGQSFARKARSYEVECHWYEHYAQRCSHRCKVPQCLGVYRDDTCAVLLLEDLAVEYPRLRNELQVEEALVCLQWLAEFHALFLHDAGSGLWERGGYWHLDTRPDEWQAMSAGELKQAASWLDEQLKQTRYQTLLHGDAKVANFCFSQDMQSVSAVDFQYVGRGCGMSDVVYFLGSCLSEEQCRDHEESLLSHYFASLRAALEQQSPGSDTMACALEAQWRTLYPVAWADFNRFLLGWMPDHSKLNRYGQELTSRALRGWPGPS